jgi:hypothetical protein
MRCSPSFPFSVRQLLGLALAVALPAASLRAKDEPVAVFSQVYNGYARTRLADKSFAPEKYVFGEGELITRLVKDASVDKLSFSRVASAVAVPLAHLNYHPALKADEAQLLILVFWGSTQGSRGDSSGAIDQFATASAAYSASRPPSEMSATASMHPSSGGSAEGAQVAGSNDSEYDSALWLMSMQNDDRDRLDERNARILGYEDALERARFTSHMAMGQDVLSEISNNRYFVVLQAYDFKTARKEKKLKPLWTTRISIDETGDFVVALDSMLTNAARFFGQASDGLQRNLVPEGRVDVGPAKVIDDAPKK